MSIQMDHVTFARCADRVAALTTLEWQVVRFARNEKWDGVETPGRFRAMTRRIASTLFGWTYPRPLADARLELLRRFAVAVTRNPGTAESLAIRLIAAGFSEAQLCTVRNAVRH